MPDELSFYRYITRTNHGPIMRIMERASNNMGIQSYRRMLNKAAIKLYYAEHGFDSANCFAIRLAFQGFALGGYCYDRNSHCWRIGLSQTVYSDTPMDRDEYERLREYFKSHETLIDYIILKDATFWSDLREKHDIGPDIPNERLRETLLGHHIRFKIDLFTTRLLTDHHTLVKQYPPILISM